jgi:hypothetical protein
VSCRTHCRCTSRQCERVKLPLKVATLDVVEPLTLALDGDAAVLTIVTAVEFGLEVGCSDTCCWYTQHHWYMWLHWYTRHR